MFHLDIQSRKPIYEQLMDKLKEMIIHDVLKTDEQLPSVRSLAQELTINPNTIQKAYRELEREEYIYSLPGKGSFVAAKKETTNEGKVAPMKKELERLIAEILYLGVPKEELINLIHTISEKKEEVE